MSKECRSCTRAFEGKWYNYGTMRSALYAGAITTASYLLAHLQIIPGFLETSLYVVAIVLGGYHWSREGLEEFLNEKKVGIDILMIAAAAGSMALGMWDEAAFLVFLYGAAESLEEYTFAKTRASIRKLLDLAPKEARVLKDGNETVVPAAKLAVGDVFVVRPGESMATDGIIVRGRSSVNESPVTGESIPVEKEEGMKVFAATLNQTGFLEIRATTAFENNTLSKIVHMVEEAQEKKGRAQLFIDRFGEKYSPIVLLSAFLLLVIPPLLGLPFSDWARRAVVLLVAAAPCALIMSTPVAIAAGIGRAGKSGILIKGGMHLENLGKTKVVAFDKTGTLTRGKPAVAEIVSVAENESVVLNLACSIERFSEHPLARAIMEKSGAIDNKYLEVKNFGALVGSGVKAELDGETVYVGTVELFEKLGHGVASMPQLQRLRSEGNTVVLVGTGKKIAGLIAIRDEIRPEAKEAVAELGKMGIKIVMLTGDNDITAQAVAGSLGISDVRANLKPENKIAAIKELKKRYGAVVMVGDGINDAPALAEATVGMAMGAAGTDAAIEAADAALMADDLMKVVDVIRLGKKTRRISFQNIVFSISLLVVLIPLSLTGAVSIFAAVFVHEASELLAVANGLRLAKA